MSEQTQPPHSETELKIIEGAIGTFMRYGARKTTMSDIAVAAGVSRQTVYDAFGNKDEVIRASIRAVTARNLAGARKRMMACSTLGDRLRAYLEETIVKAFELLQTAGDVEELITAHNKAGKDEIAKSHLRHRAFVEEILSPYEAALTVQGQTIPQQANFIVTSTMSMKYGAADRAELDDLITSLVAAVCLLAEGSYHDGA